MRTTTHDGIGNDRVARTKRGDRALTTGLIRYVALAVLAAGLGLSCASPSPTTERATSVSAAELPPVSLTPSQTLGIHRAIGHTANVEAALVYGAHDAGIAALANRIADARIAQEMEILRVAASLGVTPEESPTSLQIEAESQRDVAALRQLSGTALEEAYLKGLVLRQARALGLVQYVLAPSTTSSDDLASLVDRARTEWVAQLGTALQIQQGRHDWHWDTRAPLRTDLPVFTPK